MSLDFKNINVDPESWDPALLFTTPPKEEKEEEEEIDEGNVQIGPTALAPGTITPTENNIETNVTAGNTNVTTVSAGDSDPEGDAALQRQLLNIAKMSEQVPEPTEEEEAARDFLTFIGKGLQSMEAVGELAEAAYIEEEIKSQAKRDAADQIELNLPDGEPFNFADQDQLDKFVQKTFDDLFKKDKEIAQIQRTILEENKELLAAKEEELKSALSKYTTYVFPENYFSSLSRPFLGIDIESPEMTFTPDQDKIEKEVLLLNEQYAAFVNDLILNDPRFIDRIGYIEGGIAASLNPLIEDAQKKQAIANVRVKRWEAELFGAERGSIDDLGFGLNTVAILNFVSGSDPDSWVRGIEKLFGFEPFEISDSFYSGLQQLNLDKTSQSLIMNEFQKDYNRLKYMYEGDPRMKLRDGSRLNYLPEGANSWIWVNRKGTAQGQRGHQKKEFNWFPAVFNMHPNGKYIYNHPATALGSTIHPTKNGANKYAREQGWELMQWKDAEKLIIKDLDDKQKFILDRHIQLMDREYENGLFEEEQFTDFLDNILKGNIADALRFLPKVVLKQVPYMAANYFTAGLYTMALEGGELGFDIAANAAAREYGVEPNDLTGQQILDWINNNEQAYDDALAKGLTAGGAIAGLERAGIGYMIKSSKFGIGAFSQLLKGNLKKALVQGRSMFTQNIKSGLNESFTEGLQTGVEQLTLGRFNALEYVNAMGEGFLGGVMLPGLGSITAATTQQVVELAQNTRLNIKDPELYNKVKIVFENGRKKLDNDYKDGLIDDSQYEERLKKLSNDRNTLLKIPTHFDVEAKQETFKIIQEISNLRTELEQIGDKEGLGKPIAQDIVKLNERLAEIFTEQGLNKQIQSIEVEVNADGNVSMQTFNTKTEADAFIDQVNESGNWDSKASKDGSGTILQNKQTGEQLIIINKETAAEVRDIAVADHEFLHALMFQTVKDNPAAATAIGKSLLGYLEKMDKNGQMTELLQERYKEYKGLPVEQQYEEALNFFADAIINEEIQVNDGIIEKIGRVIRNLLQKLPFVNISFKNNKDVYNFVKDYALRRRAGKGLNAAQRRMLTRAVNVGDNLGQGVSSQVADMIENQAGNLDQALQSKSKRTAQDLMLQYQQEGADMDIDLTQDLINQYYNLGLKAMGYSREAGDIQVQDALNFLNSEFPSIARNFSPDSGSLSNYIRNTIGQRGKGFFKAEIERKKRTISKEKLEDKGRQIVDTDQQADFDQRAKEDRGRAKVYPSSIKVIENNITGEIRAEQTTNIKDDINRAIASGKTNPKQVAQTIVEKTKSKEYRAPIKKALGRWNSEQYNNNIDRLINKAFIKTLPIAQIKRRFGKLFNIKEIDRVATVKVENGKRTDFKKPVYLIPEVTSEKINEIKDYFKAGEKRHQSLMSLIAEGIAVEQMQEIKSDRDFMNDLQGRLEIKGSNLTADQFINEVIFNLDKRNLEDKSFDVAKASTRKSKVQRITGKPKVDLSKGSYETNMDKIDAALNNIKGVDKVPVLKTEKGKDDKYGVMYNWDAIIPGQDISYGQARNEMVIDLIESFPPKDRAMVRQIIKDMSLNQSVVSGKAGQIEGARLGNLGLYGNESIFDENIPSYPMTDNSTAIIKRQKYTSKDGFISDKKWETIKSQEFQAEQDRKIPILFKIIDGLNNLKNNKNFPWFIKAITASVANTQAHPFRHLMPLRNVQIDPKTNKPFKEPYREEHSFVANNLGKLIEYGILSNQLPIVKDIIKASASQAAITVADDNKIPANKSKAMGSLFSTIIDGIIKGETMPALQGVVSFARYMEDGLIDIGEFYNLKNKKLLVDVLGFELKGINNNVDAINARKNLLNKVAEDRLTIPKAKAELKAANKVNAKSSKRVKLNKENLFNLINEDGTTEASIEAMSNADKAMVEGRKINKPTKGISVFDFDDTLAFSNSKVIVTIGNKTFKITPAEFAQQSEVLEKEGATFDFKEFNKVVKGRKGPLADLALKRQNKFGSGDIFVLTARPQASARSIQKFLKGIGLDIPLKNITGLENGSPQAKALWILDKAAKGYNDFYFADDSLAKVQAVKNILDQIDVKSDVQIAKQSRREKIDKDFNIIIEQQSGKEWYKTYSKARAKVQGARANRFEFFIPPSAEDFMGLMYKLLPKGENGNRALKWIQDHLVDPYNKAEQEIISAQISVANDFNEIRNSIDNIPDNLNDQAGYSNFTFSQALRVYIWNMQGMDIPGLSQRDKNALIKLIEDNADMKVFAEKIAFIQKDKGYPAPTADWVGGSITGDIISSIQKVYRKEALQEWQENVDIIFSEKNMNKLEAIYGSNFVAALKNILGRMKRGSNRPLSDSKQVENVMDWLNNSVGTIMFLNRKSALLQLISNVNFINWSDNNIVAAGKAFANQPQYWKDVMYLMNSDYLVQRRNGMKINVAESEIAEASKKGGMKGVVAYLLNKGFIFTRIADSLAIATGGATFYRNRVNSLQKQVNINTGKLYTQAEAEAKAFDDFYKISEESQQSSRADRISMQQASGLGRLVLNFANTPMQYARIMKKAVLDLKAGRGDWKTNLSKVLYYGIVQNLIFSAMQAAIFTLLFDEEEEKKDRTMSDKVENIGFSMISSLLRGLGYGGALVDTIISVGREIDVQRQKKSPDFKEAVWNVFDFSPAIDSKVRKLRSAADTFKFNRKQIARRGFNLENPAYLALGQVVSATLNIPLDRALRMVMTAKQVIDNDTYLWQRVALVLGYSSWQVGLPYWGTTTTIANEEKEDEEIQQKYDNDTRKLRAQGFKRIPMTKGGKPRGKPSGVLGEDYIAVTRPSGQIEYWLMPKN